MQSPRLPPAIQLKNVSNVVSPPKKLKNGLHIAQEHTPRSSAATPKTPVKSQDSFITSSPVSGKRSSANSDRKQRPKVRAPRTPSGTLFSPTYPPTIGVNKFHCHEPPTPPSNHVGEPMSPLQRSLHENVARYGHLQQLFDEYDCDDFDPYRFIASLPTTTPLVKSSCLPPKVSSAKITLVLDLDETLVHCSTDGTEIRNPDFIFHVEFQAVTYTVNCRKRPGLEEFLEYVKNRFEVVIFTASQKVYADKLLDILDPTHEAIHHRIFRDDCTNVEGNYLKDLAVLGRDLRSTVILDNSPQAFAFQLDNGIPILSWYDNRSDRELFKVIPLLELLGEADDVRPVLHERFNLHRRVDVYTELAYPTALAPTFEQCLATSVESVA